MRRQMLLFFFYRDREGNQTNCLSRGVLFRKLRSHILRPAGVTGWQHFTLRSFRPGGATDMAMMGVPDTVIRKLGKWSADSGIEPYNRVDLHILRDLAVYREAMQRGRYV